ncbi:hypothetical protein TWF281_003612 [Arthrobotrys megalospora]
MEVVGGVASVIAIVDLAAKIAKICAGYINEVRDYEVEIKAVKDRVQCTGKVLEELDGLLKGPHQEKLKTSLQLQNTLTACKDELEELLKRIERKSPVTANQPGPSNKPSKGFMKFFSSHKKGTTGATISNVARILIWPIEKAEVAKIITRLEGMEDAIKLAIQIDQTKVILDVDVKLNLVNLPVAEGASFGWYGDGHEPKCLPSTREELLRKVDDWVNGPTDKYMFWLSGAAGTGKSTIARTVAETYQRAGLLGASFFFRRGAGDRANASKFFTTLATNLMQHIPAIRARISSAIEQEPDLPRKVLKEQFDKLVLEPILASKHQGRIVLVIDALDECDNDKDVLTIVRLLGLMKPLKSMAIDVRIFVTSRREVFINAGFQKISGDFQDLVLHDIEEQKILHDITVFLEYELRKIKTDHAYRDTLPPSWPEPSIIETLARMSCPLFIIASTICRFIEEPETLPADQLKGILERQHKLIDANPEMSLRATYLQIINQRVKNKTASQIKEMLREFQDIIGTIVLLQSPLSQASLSRFIDMQESKIRVRLDGFQSVIHLPAAPDEVIKTFHLSFREFLLDPQTQEQSPLWIEECQVHSRITERCINIMKKHLRKNVCDLESPDSRRDSIPPDTIQKTFPPELQYACRYWAYHLKKSGQDVRNGGIAHTFLQDYVLEWLEATSILRINFYNIDTILGLESATSEENGDQISKLLSDIRRFIRYNYEVIDGTPLQIYHSALLFSPQNCLLRQKFYPLHLDWVREGPQVPEDWGSLLQKIQVDDRTVRGGSRSLTFSPNGERITVTSGSGGARTWDLKTGALLKSDTNFTSSPIYSPDGAWAVAQVGGGNMVISDYITGVEVKKIVPSTDHSSEKFVPVEFSPDGKYFLSIAGLGGEKSLLWDTATWDPIRSWGPESTYGGLFSHDSSLVVTWNWNRGLMVWDVGSGDLLQEMPELGLDGGVVKFSPNREWLGYASDGDMIILRLTGKKLKWVPQIRRSGSHFTDVAFLSNDEVIAIDHSGTVLVWRILESGLTPPRIIGRNMHESYFATSIGISPDGKILATLGRGEHDQSSSLRLWDIAGPLQEDVDSTSRQKLGSVIASHMVDFVTLSMNCDFIASGSAARGQDEGGSRIILWRISCDRVTLHKRLSFREYREEDYKVQLIRGTFSWGGKLLALIDDLEGILGVWDTESGDAIYTSTIGKWSDIFEMGPLQLGFNGARLPTTQFAFSPDNKLLALSSSEYPGPTVIVDLNSCLEPIRLSSRLKSRVNDSSFLAFSKQGNILAWVGPSSCELWCTERWVIIKTLTQGLQLTTPLSDVPDVWELEHDGGSGLEKLKFDLRGPSKTSKKIGAGNVAWSEGWIVQNGVKVLWVPPSFRGNNQVCWEIRGDMVVVGNSNCMDIWRFESPIS